MPMAMASGYVLHWFLWWSWLLWASRCLIFAQPGRDCLMLCSQNITCALECAACDYDCCSSTCDSSRPGDICDPVCYGSSLNVTQCCVSPPMPPPTPAPIIPGPGNCSVIDILVSSITMVEGIPYRFDVVAIDSTCSGSTCLCTTPYLGPANLLQVRIFDSGTGFTPPKTACNVSEGSSSGVFSVSCVAQNSLADANARYILFVTLYSYGLWVVPIGFTNPAITIIAGPVYVPACIATWFNNTSTFVAGTMATLNVTQKDSFNNTVAGVTGRSELFSFQLAIIANPAINTSTSFQSFNVTGDANQGFQTVTFYPTTAGMFYLQVGNGTHVIQKSPFRFKVIPAPLSVADSSAVWPNGVNFFEAGSNASLAILQLDRFGNIISAPTLALFFFHLEGSAPAALNATFAPLEIDTDYIAATFMPVQAGQYSLHVGNGTEELQMSPFTFSVASGSIAVENCTGSWLGFKSTFIAGDIAEFNVLQMDAYGNNVSLATSSLSFYDFTVNISTATDYRLFPIPSLVLLPSELGSAFRTITFTPEVAGTYLLNVGSNSINISKSPFLFRVLPGPMSIPACIGDWPSGNRFQAGINGSLEIHKRDKYNNSVFDPYIFIATIVSSSSDIPVGSLPNLNLQVENVVGADYDLVTFMSTLSGNFTCEVGSSTDAIANSPLDFFVTASSVSGSACIASWPKGLNRFSAGIEARLDVLLKDTYNNTVSLSTGGYDYSFMLSADVPNQSYSYSFDDNPSAGIKTIKFYPTLAGTYSIDVQSSTGVLTGSPFQFIITAGSVWVWNCTASWLGGNIFDAGSRAVIQILLMDAYGNNVSLATGRNDSYNFVVEVQGYPDAINNWNVTVVPQNYSGFQSVIFYPVESGLFNLRIGSKTKNISGSPFPFSVNPGPLSIPDCTGEWLGGTEFHLQNSTVTFLLYPRDVYGNVLPSNGLSAANFTALIYFAANLSMLGVPNMQVTQGANSSYMAFRFNMTKVGRFILQIGNASEDISGSPFLFTVTTDNVDPSKAIIDGAGLKNSTAGVTTSFLVQLRDSGGNSASANASDMSVQFTRFSMLINITTNITIVPKSSGAFLFSYVAVLAGDYKIIVLWRGIVLGGGPAIKKSVLPAKIYGPWCTASYSGVSQGEAGLSTSFLITTVDAFNNTMPTGPVNISVKFYPTVTDIPTVINNKNGTYTIKCNISKSGFYNAFVYAGSSAPTDLIRGSPFQITVVSGPISIPDCRGVFIDGNVISENSPVRFVLMLRDKFKNRAYRVLNQTVSSMFSASVYTRFLNIPVDTPNMTIQQFATNTYATDQVFVMFILNQRGEYKLEISSNGTKINAGNPYYFSIVQEAPSLLNSTFAGTGLADSVAGDVTSISIALKDYFGSPVVSNPSMILVNVTMDDTFYLLSNVFEIQSQQGMYISNYTATIAGDYTIYISWANVLLVSYNKTVFPADPVPSKCVASGSGLTGGEAGITLEFTISAFDRFGNPSAPGHIAYLIQFAPNYANTTTTWIGSNGFSVTYTIWKARNYSVTVIAVGTDDQVPVPGSPFLIAIDPGPPDTNVAYITGEGASNLASVMKWNELVIIMVDIFENPVLVDASGFKVIVNGPGPCSYKSFVRLAPGKFRTSYRTSVEGSYEIMAWYEDQLLPECPMLVQVRSGTVTAKDFKTMILPNTSVPAGIDVTFVTYANYTTMEPMRFIVEIKSSEFVVALVADEDNGKYIASVNATYSGLYTIEVTLYGSLIQGTYTAEVKPGGIFVPLCTVIDNMLEERTASVGVPKTMKVQARDKFENKCYTNLDDVGNPVTFTMILSGPSMKVFNLEYTTKGVYAGSFIASEVGVFDLSIFAGLEEINGSPFIVTVT